MHPVLDKRLLMIALTLGELVFVVRKDQVKPSAVNVKAGAKKTHAHG